MPYSSSTLGEGYFGKVRKGLYNGRPAAIKTVPLQKVDEDDLRRECRVYQTLNHKNIVKLLGPPERKVDGWHLPLELIEGSTLHELIFTSRGKLSTAEKDFIILGMCEGLNYLHENDVVHQDLKPDNIMVERSTKRAVIIDLGLAKFICYNQSGSPFSSGANFGCFEYTAPEALEGGIRTRKSDVWSMGKVIAEVLLGYMLNRDNCIDQVDIMQLRSSKYADIVRRMLHEIPKYRITMPDVLWHIQNSRETFAQSVPGQSTSNAYDHSMPGQQTQLMTVITYAVGFIAIAALVTLAFL